MCELLSSSLLCTAIMLETHIPNLKTCAGVALEALSADEYTLTNSHHTRSKTNPDMPWRKSKLEKRRKLVPPPPSFHVVQSSSQSIPAYTTMDHTKMSRQ